MNDRRNGILARVAAVLSLLAAGPARATEFQVHGLLDLVATERNPAFDTNLLTRGDSSFDPYGLRLFADARVNPRLQVFTQLVLRDASSIYVDGAYLLFTPSPTRDLHVLAGKIPWPIGTYAPRTYSNKNPLIGAPLMYQYHTTLVWFAFPASADALLATAGSGQYGVDYFGFPMGRGMPVVDDSYWDVGVTVAGSQRPLEYALGMVAGTPGWGVTSQDENSGKSVLGRVGLQPTPWLRLGVSGSYGPYLHQSLNPSLPPGRDANDYRQQLAMADVELSAGHVEVRGEAARNVWNTPTVGGLEVTSGYVELEYSFAVGAFLAGRWDELRFGKITDSGGAEHPWDSDVTRVEAGAGYRFNRDVIGKAVYQRTERKFERFSLVAAQLSVAF